jgi:excisionase family DNA binding protein
MSSNMELKRVCQHCGKLFIAKKTSTKFCSLACGQRNYKIRQRIVKVRTSNTESRKQSLMKTASKTDNLPEPLLVDVKMLSFMTNMSVRTIYRLMKEHEFPRVKVGKSLRFDPEDVVGYLKERFGNDNTHIKKCR